VKVFRALCVRKIRHAQRNDYEARALKKKAGQHVI
jgi:hypothetical protein